MFTKSTEHITLASYPLGPATAHGVGILTEVYVIYMERSTSHVHRFIDCSRRGGYGVTHRRKKSLTIIMDYLHVDRRTIFVGQIAQEI